MEIYLLMMDEIAMIVKFYNQTINIPMAFPSEL